MPRKRSEREAGRMYDSPAGKKFKLELTVKELIEELGQHPKLLNAFSIRELYVWLADRLLQRVLIDGAKHAIKSRRSTDKQKEPYNAYDEKRS